MFESDESRTGDLAKWVGLTTNGVRYLEKHGVIQASRDANGYRRYDNESFVAAAQYRRYRDLGMSERRAVEALEMAPRAVEGRLCLQEEELRAQYDRQMHQLELAKESLRVLARAFEAPVVMDVPAHGYVSLGDAAAPAGRERFHDAMEWGRHVPQVQMGMVGSKGPRGDWRFERMHLCPLDGVGALGLPKRHMAVIERARFACVSVALRESMAEEFDPAAALEALAHGGLASDACMLEVRVCHVERTSDGLVSYALVMVPFGVSEAEGKERPGF